MNIDALKAELISDPLGRGYAAMSDEEAAASLNVKDRSRDKTSMNGREVLAQVDLSELKTKTDAQIQHVLTICGYQDIDPDGPVKDIFVNIFGGTSATIAALAAARVETISRGMEIDVGKVKPGNVQEARV